MEGKNLSLILKDNTWLPRKEKTESTLAQEGILLESTLGEGAYAKVKSAYYKKLKKKVAVKIISKLKAPKDYMEKFLRREIAMMSELDHPNIIQLIAIFETDDKIFLVMELAEGGDLLDHVNEQKYQSEEEIKKHFLQFASAMCYSHQVGIVHRDLKLENLVQDKYGNLKVTDFGFARRSLKGNAMETCCGSFAYACPTILQGKPYDGFAADVWSMGIVLYAMFTYKLPYNDVDLKMLAKGCGGRKLKFTKDTPNEARDLIRRMLDPDENTRITCQQIIGHSWIRDENQPQMANLSSATADIVQPMNSETSGSSMTSSNATLKGPIVRDNCPVTEPQTENEQEGEKQFQILAVRRATITSQDTRKILADVVQPKPANFANTVKKKRVAIMCLGGLGKKKKDKKAEEPVSGSIIYNDKHAEKVTNFSDLVTQIVKNKKTKTKLDKKDREEMKRQESDDEIEQMRRELQSLSQNDSTTLAKVERIQKDQRSEIETTQRRMSKGKVGKWKKVCNKLVTKGS